MGELKVYATNSTYIAEDFPNQNFSSATILEKLGTSEESKKRRYGLLEFDFPSILQSKSLKYIDVYIYVTEVTDGGGLLLVRLNSELKSLNFSTVTWNNTTDLGGIYDINNSGLLITNKYCQNRLSVSSEMWWKTVKEQLKDGLFRIWVNAYYNKYYITFSGKSAKSTADKPYIIYHYDDVFYTEIHENPKDSIYANPKKEIMIKWEYRRSNYETVVVPKNRIIKTRIIWRETGKSQAHFLEQSISLNFNDDILTMQIVVPENTFPTKSHIEWFTQIMLEGESFWRGNGSAGDNHGQQEFVTGGYATFSTTDSISSAQIISPANVYLSTADANRFEWRHIIATGTSPTKSELQYSRDGATWQPLATVNGSATTTTIPAHTLYGGTNYWRVRTYNNDGAAGNWSDPASFVVRGAPAPPKIASVTNTPRPIVRWQAADQSGYQVQILDKTGKVVDDSGEVYGTLKAYAAADYLAYGSYTVRVRIKSGSGMWSAWVNGSAEVPPITIAAPMVSYTPHDGYVEIQVSNSSSFAKLYLIRDGAPIAKITGGTYKDYTAGPSQIYFVRGVTASDLYADSAPEVIRCPIDQGATLALIGNPAVIFQLLIRRGELPKLTGQTNYNATANNYAGREYPVYSMSEHKVKSFELTFSLRAQQDWVRLCQLIDSRQVMIYRDMLGNKEYGVILASSHTQDRISTDFTLTFDRCDYVEKIDYDLPPGV